MNYEPIFQDCRSSTQKTSCLHFEAGEPIRDPMSGNLGQRVVHEPKLKMSWSFIERPLEEDVFTRLQVPRLPQDGGRNTGRIRQRSTKRPNNRTESRVGNTKIAAKQRLQPTAGLDREVD